MAVNKYFKFTLLLLLFLVPICLFYRKMFDGFFIQDELYSFGYLYVLHKGDTIADLLRFFFAPSITHYNPLTNLFEYILLSMWGMNYTKFVWLGIILHTVVTISVFSLAKKVFKNNILKAAGTAIIFATFASIYQATAWVIVDVATLTASLLGIISTIFFISFLESKNERFLLKSILLLILSLLFKEITIGLFPLFFIILFLRRKDKIIKKSLRVICFIGFLYFVFRVLMIFIPNTSGGALVTESQNLSRLLYNFLTIPHKALVQTMLPAESIKQFSFLLASLFPEKISGPSGSPAFEVFAVKRVMEVLSLILSLIITTLVILISRKKENKKYKSFLLFSLIWIFSNSLIFSLSPEVSGIVSAVDSRNLYFVAVGVAFLIVMIVSNFSKDKVKTLAIFAAILIPNLFWLNKNLTEFTDQGKVRKRIIEKISAAYSDIPEKTVFYINSNQSYFGLEEKDKILPFQSGLGHSLLVFYYSQENFPKEFFENEFLWEIKSQGYKEVNGIGFGYFREIELLTETIQKYNLPVESVVAFSWDGYQNKLLDITEKTREEISKLK